jgi:glycosyltransferase involved in cell wall biosynthesis
MDTGRRLLLTNPLTAVPTAGGKVIVTDKLVSGIDAITRAWSDPVTVVLEPALQATNNLDNIEVDPGELPFVLKVMRFDAPDFKREVLASCVVSPFASHRQNHIAALCRRAGVPYVYVAEYSLRTRFQIIRVERNNPLRRARGYWWEVNQERKQRKIVRAAAGVQCNGTPAYQAYRSINPRPFLYFDARIEPAMIPSDQELGARMASLRQGKPLRLVFSGRLIKLKGADHLPRVAAALMKLGVEFEMYICGDGVLAPVLAEEVRRRGLRQRVRLMGTLEFRSELVPFLKERADLFVCCHRQGDPSCSYVEALACGLPIVGYANEAFLGILAHANVGWSVPMDQPEAIADIVRQLDSSRSRIADAAMQGVLFARRNTHEQTVARRVEHLRSIASRATGERSS